MPRHVQLTSARRDRSTWLFVLLVLLMVLPSACVIWFLNEAVTTQSAAARQRVLDAYRGQLRLVRSRVDAYWRARAASLDGGGNAAQRFERMVLEHGVDGAVLLDSAGRVVYPDRRPHRSAAAAALERDLSAAERLSLPAGDDRLETLALRLNDYGQEMTGVERLALMQRLRRLTSNVSLPTEAALRLSIDLLTAERPVPTPGALRETAVRDVWAIASDDSRAIALYRTGRLESMMHDFLHQVTPAGIVFVASPPDVMGGDEAIAAGAWMPGWQLSFQPLDMAPFEADARRRIVMYVAVAVGGIAVMMVLGAAAGRTLRRQIRLARLKTDLVAAASHELRTPLASMRVLVDGLLDDERLDPEKTRDYLGMLASENARLSRLIENFLTFSRLDGGRYAFARAPVDPAAIVRAAVAAVRDRIPSTCDFRVDVASPLPALMGDADALETALVNLLDNALKYAPADGRIVVRARLDGDDALSFVVEDNGIGIPVHEHRRIFRRFHRVDQRLARESGGVGLGLSIVEMIARGHGGTVRVHSAPGAGSTFVFRVPCPGEASA